MEPEAPKQNYNDTLEKVDKDEKLLAVIKRHPFGIIKMYATVIVGMVFAGALLWMILPGLLPRDENEVIYSIIAVIAVTLVGLMAFILFVATIIYFRSKLVITDKTITQTIQNGLFNRKISQLAVTNIEDVTANKNGFFPTILNYGRLLVETAGEQENFHFDYCPNADHYAKLILEAREQFIANPDTSLRSDGRNTAAMQQQQYIMQNQAYQQQAQGMPMQAPAPQYQPQTPATPTFPNQQPLPQTQPQQYQTPVSMAENPSQQQPPMEEQSNSQYPQPPQ